jgi:hypothetical protein
MQLASLSHPPPPYIYSNTTPFPLSIPPPYLPAFAHMSLTMDSTDGTAAQALSCAIDAKKYNWNLVLISHLAHVRDDLQPGKHGPQTVFLSHVERAGSWRGMRRGMIIEQDTK